MANNNYDHLIKLGIDRSEVNRVITDLNTAFGKQYKLKIDLSDLTEATQALFNLSKTSNSAALPDTLKNQAATKMTDTVAAADAAETQAKTALENIGGWVNSTIGTFEQLTKEVKRYQNLKNDLSNLS